MPLAATKSIKKQTKWSHKVHEIMNRKLRKTKYAHIIVVPSR